MKTKSINTLALTILLGSVGVVQADDVQTKHHVPYCMDISGAGHTDYDPTQSSNTSTGASTFVGTGTVTIDGKEHTADVEARVLGVSKVDADGTLHSVTSYRFTLTDLPNPPFFVTFDEGLVSPTADPFVSRLSVVSEVRSGGTGLFNNRSGTLLILGQSTNAEVAPGVIFPVAVDFTMNGRLCRR